MSTTTTQQNTVYIVDANFFINFHKWIPQSSFPAFWAQLEQALKDGKWVLLDVVVNEVRGEPALKRWCILQKQNGLVTEITDTDKIAGAAINNKYEMVDQASGKSEVDTYIIAHAKANGYGIASDEKQRKTIADLYKIPDVCGKLGIISRRKPTAFFTEVGIMLS